MSTTSVPRVVEATLDQATGLRSTAGVWIFNDVWKANAMQRTLFEQMGGANATTTLILAEGRERISCWIGHWSIFASSAHDGDQHGGLFPILQSNPVQPSPTPLISRDIRAAREAKAPKATASTGVTNGCNEFMPRLIIKLKRLCGWSGQI